MSILEKVNAVPTYTFTLPSTGEKITYRPFLHREEKNLMIAKETGSNDDYLTAIKSLITNCSFGKLDPDTMASFDIEEFFIRIREKSIGEVINMSLICQQEENGVVCGWSNPITINLKEIKIPHKSVPKDNFNVKLNDEVSVQLGFPNFNTLEKILKLRLKNQEGDTTPDETLEDTSIIATIIKSITIGTDIVEAEKIEPKELKDFLDNLTSKQVEELFNVILKTPSIEYTAKIKCNKCMKDITYTFKGLYDFFI